MIISGSGRNSFETIFVNMWCRAAGLPQAAPAATNVNLNGMAVSLDPSLTFAQVGATLDVPLGQSCFIGAINAEFYGLYATGMGICATDLIVGDNGPRGTKQGGGQGVKKWILVQTYGHKDRIICNLATVSDDRIFGIGGHEDGAVQTWSIADLDSPMTLSGTANIAAGAAVMNMNGTDTATVTWGGVPPTVYRGDTSFAGIRPLPSRAILGWKYIGAYAELTEAGSVDATWSGFFKQIPGFIVAMGISPRG